MENEEIINIIAASIIGLGAIIFIVVIVYHSIKDARKKRKSKTNI